MGLVAPLVLVGLGALALPVLIHLIQRERKRVVEFPSLMFVRRIPYQSVRRRRIRHWLPLLMRAAALALIVAPRAPRLARRPRRAPPPGPGPPGLWPARPARRARPPRRPPAAIARLSF